MQEDLMRLPKHLSKLEIQVLQIYCGCNPYPRAKIAERLNVFDKKLYNATNRCKRKTRQVLYG